MHLRLLRPLFIFICSVLSLLPSIGQTTVFPPGCSKTSRIEYRSEKRQEIHDAITTSDGGRIAVGNWGTKAMVLRLKDNGDILWTKNFDQNYTELKPRRIIRATDGNYYIFSNTYFNIDHYAHGHIIITKMNENGNIINSVIVNLQENIAIDYAAIELADVATVYDNGFVMIINQSYGSGVGQVNYVVRFDANANIVWRKQVQPINAGPIYKSVTVTGDVVILAWDSYDFANAAKFGIDKLSLTTGEKIWANRYTADPPGYYDDPLTFNRMSRVLMVNDTIYSFIDYFVRSVPFNSPNHTAMICIGPNGNVLKTTVFKIGNNMLNDMWNYLDDVTPIVTLTPEKNFIISHRIIEPAGESLNISCVTRDGTISWSRNYPAMGGYKVFNIRQQGRGYIILGAVAAPTVPDPYFRNGFIVKVDEEGLTVNTASAECAPIDAVATTENITVSIALNAIDAFIDDPHIGIRPGNLVAQNLSVEALLYCREPGNCSPVTIEKANSACATGDTLIYYLKDATDCNAIATWKYDNRIFKLISEKLDTIKLSPLKKGLFTIGADLEGNCFYKNEHVNINIIGSAREIELGKDTLLCPESTIELKAPSGYARYEWNDGSRLSSIFTNIPGKYYVTVADNCGGLGSDTIYVLKTDKLLGLPTDTTKCNKEPVLLLARDGYTNYYWEPATTLQAADNRATVNPDSDTKYNIKADIWPGCTIKGSVQVTVLHSPPIDLGIGKDICPGEYAVLDAGSGFSTYVWNTGSTSQTVQLYNPGQYNVIATAANSCKSKASFELRWYTAPVPVLKDDLYVCPGIPATLQTNRKYNQYLWSDGSRTPKLIVDQPGQYWVKVTDEHNCVGTTTVNVIQRFCKSGLYVPNIFSPNGDGKNEQLKPTLAGNMSDFSFSIYSRWGQKIFETSTPGQAWDGKINGLPAPSGSYAWTCYYTIAENNNKIQKFEKGLVQLIR